MTPFRRLATTAIILGLFALVSLIMSPMGEIAQSRMATMQLQNSDAAYAAASLGMGLYGFVRIIAGVAAVAILLALWWKPVRRLLMAIVPAVLLAAPAAHAYYDKTDYTETVEIMPNQSVFLIPEMGANKDSQAQFMSQDYLAQNKVPAKRIIIPHATLGGSGLLTNYYVPAARAYVVDRTPYHREWSDQTARGTSARAEGFHFESQDSLDIGTSIAIAAYVREEDAAKFLYWFGTKPPEGDPADPHTQYASVLHSYSLAEVMDGIVRGKVQAALAQEFGRLKLDDAMAHKAEIMARVEATVKAEFAPKGITIDYIGYAGGLDYDERVQRAINDLYIGQQQAKQAQLVKDAIPTLTGLATIMAIQGAGAGMHEHGLPNLPSVLVLPPELSAAAGKLLQGGQP